MRTIVHKRFRFSNGAEVTEIDVMLCRAKDWGQLRQSRLPGWTLTPLVPGGRWVLAIRNPYIEVCDAASALDVVLW